MAARASATIALLVWLAAVVVPPLAGPAPASELAGWLLQPLRPLVGAAHLGHGYRFFAPNPGPGHSLLWTMTMPDGSTRNGRIPDPVADRPRLLYHRRFMVSEKIAVLVPPFGNHGLWLAYCLFAVVRAATLVFRYPRLERSLTRA